MLGLLRGCAAVSVSISREGRRSYILGETFALKGALKEAGAHWDSERRAWWMGSHADATALLGRLMDPEVAQELKADQDAERLDRDRGNILGTATKDGNSYYLVGEGRSSKGDWIRLLYRDGSKTFFADRETVQITKRYRGAVSLRKLQAFAEEKKVERKTGVCQCSCHRSAGHFGSGGFALFDGCDRCGCEDDG
jgi:hypothetical protein